MNFAKALGTLGGAGPVLCVGLDPHPEILSLWGCSDSPAGLSDFVQHIVPLLVASPVALVKPQVALFERHGVRGMSVLANLLGRLRQASILTIGDAKRGDIGSTMAGYAEAWLIPGADFEVDALTVSPYLGVGALLPALDLALENGKGAFVLAATSNPEGQGLQSARTAAGPSVAGSVHAALAEYSRKNPAAASSHGVVVGATVDWSARGVDLLSTPGMPVLVPGFGAQGVDLAQCRSLFPGLDLVLPVSARELLNSGREGFLERIEMAHREALT